MVGGGANSGNLLHDLRNPLPSHVVIYIEQYGTYGKRLDSRCFSDMLPAGDVDEIRDVCAARLQDNAVGAWIKRWWHSSGRRATDLLGHYTQMNRLCICCFKEVGYERRLSDILQWLGSIPYPDWAKDPGEVIGFYGPYDRLYLFSNCCYRSHDIDFEHCMRVHTCGFLLAWHNLDCFTSTPLMGLCLYAARWSWWDPVECCHGLTVPISVALAYYSNLVVDKRSDATAI